MSATTLQLIAAAIAANNALLEGLSAQIGGDDGAAAGEAAAPATRGRGRPSNADKAAAAAAAAKLTNDEVSAIVTKVKDHPKGGLPMAKELIAEVGAKKIADIKDQATLVKLKDAAEARLAELDADEDGEL